MVFLLVADSAPLGIGDDVLHAGNRKPLADAGALVDPLVLAGGEGDAFHHLAQELGHHQLVAVALAPGFLCSDGHAFIDGRRIMSANFRADAVFQRSDDLAAGRVVLGIGGEHQSDIQRQADRIALNLHVAFLHDVEQPDLDLAGEIGQLVDGEDAAISARQQPVVDRQFVRELVPAARSLDGIDIADQVGDGHIRRGQLFHVAVLGREVDDGCLVAAVLRSASRQRQQMGA